MAKEQKNNTQNKNSDKKVSEKGSGQGGNSDKKVSEKGKKPSKKILNAWVFKVLFLTLGLSLGFSFASEFVIGSASLVVAYLLIVFLILVGVLFDIIGTAVTACDIQPLLAMSARKVKGAKMSVKLVQNAEKIASICTDIIGDIFGIISGACGASIVLRQFAMMQDTALMVMSVIFSSVTAALLVTGKAIGKSFAIQNSVDIVFCTGKILSVFRKN